MRPPTPHQYSDETAILGDLTDGIDHHIDWDNQYLEREISEALAGFDDDA